MNKFDRNGNIILELLSEIYIAVMILIFPLIVNKTGFLNILECKWHSYLLIATIYIGSVIVIILYYRVIKVVNCLKGIKLTKAQWCIIMFLIINILSCCLSPFVKKYNLLIGVGRGEGLLMICLYSVTFLFISLFGKFKKRFLVYFSISSILVSTIIVLQTIGFNPFNMYQGNNGIHNISFRGTIGNVDFVSAIYCIFLSVSFTSYVFLKNNNKIDNVIHLLSIFLGAYVFGTIEVQSGKVTFIFTLFILIPLIFTSSEKLSKFLRVMSLILLAYCTNVIINPIFDYKINSLRLDYQFNYMVILFIIVILGLLAVSKLLGKYEYDYSKNKKVIQHSYFGVILLGLFMLVFIYFYSFKSGILYEMHELMHGNFNDKFGTYRIFLWKRSFKIVPDYFWFGSGPDTFIIRFMDRFTNDIAAIGPLTLNDTAANVYLTMFINIGVIGLFTYILFIYFLLKDGINKFNNGSVVLLIPIICYLCQDFFNLSVVIVTPIFWLLLGIYCCFKKNDFIT